jgi:hypothetical protein
VLSGAIGDILLGFCLSKPPDPERQERDPDLGLDPIQIAGG